MTYVLIFSSFAYFLVFPINFSPIYAQISFYLTNIFFTLLLIWLLAVIIVKYLTIFHQEHLNFNMTDSEIVNHVQKFVILSEIVLFLVEHNFLSDLEDNMVYCQLAGIERDGNHGLPKTIQLLIGLIIFAAIVLQIQIERKGLRKIPNENEPGKYWIRFFTTSIILFMSFLVYAVAKARVLPNTKHIFSGWVVILGTTIPIPLFFVLTSQRIREYIKRRFLINSPRALSYAFSV